MQFTESAAFYQEKVHPYIQSLPAQKLKWVENILAGTQEADRVLLRDTDPTTGFVLLPGLKWDQQDVEQMYCMALVHTRVLASMRDLTDINVPLLLNIKQKGLACLKTIYGVAPDKIQTYLHYHPSHYHLHM